MAMSNERENAEEDYITTPISVLRYITELESQLEEAIKIAENAIKNWGDTAYSYGSYSDEIDLEEIKLEQLKEKTSEL